MSEWLEIASSPAVVRRGARTAVIVGTLLIAINYGDAILHAELGPMSFVKMALTVLVPYLVSTSSSVSAVRGQRESTQPGMGNPSAPEPTGSSMPPC